MQILHMHMYVSTDKMAWVLDVCWVKKKQISGLDNIIKLTTPKPQFTQ